MKRIFLIILILPITLFAQNEQLENASIFATNQTLNTTIINKKLVANSSNQFVDRGLFAMKGTLAVGFPSAYTGTNMYVSGNMEYYLEKMVSFRGGLYLFLGTLLIYIFQKKVNFKKLNHFIYLFMIYIYYSDFVNFFCSLVLSIDSSNLTIYCHQVCCMFS